MFILATSVGKFRITDEEAKDLAKVKGGEVFIRSIGASVNLAYKAALYPENHPDVIEERKNQQTGRLYDGSRVKRHFGTWVDADNTTVDDKGNYVPIRIDPNYYPEVATDSVFTEEEYEKIKHLPTQEKLKLVVGERGQRKTSELTSIGTLLS